MGSSLFHIMSMGSESLSNARAGIDVTGHNIANAHTEGFSRQRVNVTTAPPISYGMQIFGNGAKIQSVERVHDKYLEGYLRKELQSSGESDTRTKGLARIEQLFNPELTATVRARMQEFTNSVRELANYPEETSVRTNLIESSKALTQAFNVAHEGIFGIQRDTTNEINDELSGLNQKLAAIASLNGTIKEMSNGPNQANDLLDKRDELIKAVSETIDTQIYEDRQGTLTIRGPNGALLVEGVHAGKFFSNDTSGLSDKSKVLFQADEFAATQDLTSVITGGKIAGSLQVRDVHAQAARDELNHMAEGFANAFNELHRKGHGVGEFSSTNGRDFFVGHNGEEAAKNIDISGVMIADSQAISAAMSPDTPGDNVIANELVRMFQKPVLDGGRVTIADFYDRLIGRVGVDSMRAQEENNASKVVMAQLHEQREGVSGVSLDEEAAALLKYQHLFAASSRVITTVDQMFETILGLKR